MSRLRKTLHSAGRDRLGARPPGYRLQVEPDELDLDAFEQLGADGRAALARGDATRAAELLKEAEALWRGPPLAGLEVPNGEVRRLEELRLAAVPGSTSLPRRSPKPDPRRVAGVPARA